MSQVLSQAFKRASARRMRGAPTGQENSLRNWLVRCPPYGAYRWKTQSVVRGYILDFYQPALRVGIEVDGGYHLARKEYDRVRDGHLAESGVRIIRFTNEQVASDPLGVLETIRQACSEVVRSRRS